MIRIPFVLATAVILTIASCGRAPLAVEDGDDRPQPVPLTKPVTIRYDEVDTTKVVSMLMELPDPTLASIDNPIIARLHDKRIIKNLSLLPTQMER